MMRRSVVAAVLGTLFFLAPVAAFAQVNATISGSVVDPDGIPVPGATITVTDEATGYQQVFTSGSQGRYRVPGLRPGVYTVSVELQGFKRLEQTGLRMAIAQETTLDWTLELATVEETVTVTAQTPLIETTRATVETNITETQIQNLPVKSRRWIDLATLTPGTSQDNIRGFYYNNVNIGAGTQYYASGFEVDGVNNTWAEMGEPRQNFPADSIAEFSVQTQNFKAEHGLATGGLLKTVTKSGTNNFHGQAYWYFRNETMTATDPFQDAVPDYARHQFGGNFGGPIVENQTHIFGSVERTDETDFYTVNTLGVHPSYEGTFTRDNFRNMYVVKGDHQWNYNNHTFVRYAREREYRPELNTGGIVDGTAGFGFAVPRDAFVVGHNYVISDRSFFEFRFQEAFSKYIVSPYNSGEGGGHNFEPGDFGPERGADCIPAIRRPTLRLGGCNSQMGPERRWQFKPDYSYYIPEMKGSHDLKLGADYNYIQFSGDSCCGYPYEYTFTFDTDDPYDPNDPSTFPTNFSAGQPNVDTMNVHHISWFAQDDWRPTDKLTLNLGLRYDAQPGVFNEDIFEVLYQERMTPDPIPWHFGDVPGFGSYEDRGDWNNFGPRFGFAIDPKGDGSSVIRGGYGLYYQNIQTLRQFSERRAGIRGSINIIDPDYEDPLGGLTFDQYLSTAPLNISILANDFENPMSQQMSLGYSQVLAQYWAASVDVTYVKMDNDRTSRDVNYYIDPFASPRVRPHPEFGRVSMAMTINPRRYKALMLKLERRYADGMQFMANYTLSEDIDSTSSNRNFFEPDNEIGNSSADRRHRINVTGIYMMPYEIQFSGIWQWASARPVNVHSGRDLNSDGIGSDYIPGTSRNLGCRSLSLDELNAFRGQVGREPVSEFTCPTFSSVDLRASKFFDIGSTGARLEVMAQVFNLFNSENYSPPTGNLRSGSFGRVLQAGAARQAEVAAKFHF